MKCSFFCILTFVFSFSIFAKTVNNGTVNFEVARNGKRIIRLDGDWEFYKSQTFTTLTNLKNKEVRPKVDFIQVPGSWTGMRSESKAPTYGCNTYRVLISGLQPNVEYGIFSRSSPALAARVFANGSLIASYGVFSRYEEDSVPVQCPMFCAFLPDENGVVELVIQVSNFESHKAGIISPMIFAFASDAKLLRSNALLFSAIIIGMLLFVIFVNFLIWAFDKNYAQGLRFSIFSVLLLLKIAFDDFNAFAVLFFPVSYGIQVKLQNLALLSFGFFSIVYQMDKFFIKKFPNIDKRICTFSIAIGIIFLCSPEKFASRIALFLLAISILFLFYSAIRMRFAMRVRNYYVAIYAAFYLTAFGGIALDAFLTGPRLDMTIRFSEIAILFLIFCVILYLALHLEFLLRKYFSQKNLLSEHYAIYRKFAVRELPYFFKKEGFGKIALGDNAKIECSFVLVKQKTVFLEKSQNNLHEQFETIALYASKIAQTMEEAGGSVFAMSDNVISALFLNDANVAILAAEKIRDVLQKMNERRTQDYFPCVEFCVTVHFGNFRLGLLGGQNRMDCVAMSSDATLAESICTLGFCKKISVIVSELAVNKLNESEVKKLLPLGRVKFREIPYPINLYGLSLSQKENGKLEVPRAITQRDADMFLNG